jgi:hypothetical protein
MMIFRCVRSQHDIRRGCVNLRLALQLENRPFVPNATRTGNLGINLLEGPSISTEERCFKIGTAIVDLITQFDLAPKFGDHAFLPKPDQETRRAVGVFRCQVSRDT